MVPFALNPAHAVQGLINFAKSDKVKLHRKGTSRLNNDPLDCVPEDLHQLLKTLADRATEFQWNDDAVGIMQIPDPIKTTKYTNLLTNHMYSSDPVCVEFSTRRTRRDHLCQIG